MFHEAIHNHFLLTIFVGSVICIIADQVVKLLKERYRKAHCKHDYQTVVSGLDEGIRAYLLTRVCSKCGKEQSPFNRNNQ